MSAEKLLASDSPDEADLTSPSEMTARFGSRKRQLFLFALCLCGGFFVVVYIIETQPEFNQYGILKSYSSSHNYSPQGTKTILLWNSFFGDARWSLPEDTLGPDYFKNAGCPVVNCELTNVKQFLPSVELFDAVVFHVAEPFPLLHPVPRTRDPSQLYVFALMEPPGETKHILGDEGGFYNITMTYRLDSDILWPYMFFEDIESKAIVAPAVNPAWRVPPTEYSNGTLDKIVATKTKFAAWFVSHCETLSKREELTRRLQKYINVDVYGACGPLKCPHNSSKCDLMLDEDYKFYFAFENSLCLDYVTEKFYNALKRHIVPVVFGGADYSKIAPPRSYINAENFKSVEELANYLIYLTNNPKEYARYFWWREHYRLAFRSPFCDLCAKLNTPTESKKVQFYSDIEYWWLGGSCYFEPKIFQESTRR